MKFIRMKKPSWLGVRAGMVEAQERALGGSYADYQGRTRARLAAEFVGCQVRIVAVGRSRFVMPTDEVVPETLDVLDTLTIVEATPTGEIAVASVEPITAEHAA